MRRPRATAEFDIGTKPAALNADDMGSSTEASNPEAIIGTAIGRSMAPKRPRSEATPEITSACEGSSTNPRTRLRSRDQMSINSRGVGFRDIATGRVTRAVSFMIVASIISAIGVMPAIGSVENWPSEYETAPSSLPSIYTGLPLMPAMTPVLASGPPSSRARIRLRSGPMTLRITPRISTLNSSSLVPVNTVRPTPIMPGRRSSSGMWVTWASGETAMTPMARTAAIHVRKFI